MRYAIFADVHANEGALRAALNRCQMLGIDRFICLGDIVGYGTRPNECCQILMNESIPSIAGNHDLAACGVIEPVDFGPRARRRILWTRTVLQEKYKHYLKSLQQTRVIDDAFVIVHGALQDHAEYLLNDEAINLSFALLKEKYPELQLCFFGHTHKTAAHELNRRGLTKLRALEFELKVEAHYLVNPGSLGCQRYKDSPLSFAIYDSAHKTVQILRLEERNSSERYKEHAKMDTDFTTALIGQYLLFAFRRGKRFIRNRLAAKPLSVNIKLKCKRYDNDRTVVKRVAP